MTCKVKVKKSQLDYFRKLARNSDREILAYMIGRVVSPELTVIEYFVYPQSYEVQEKGYVKWFDDEWASVKQQAEEEGFRIVGDIHSHPEWDAVLSPLDYKTHIEEGNRLTGLCSVMGRRTRVRFWIAESSLPCDIEYT